MIRYGETLQPKNKDEALTMLWETQSGEARQLIDSFTSPHEPYIEAQIALGLEALVKDSFIYAGYDEGNVWRNKLPLPLRRGIDWTTVRQELVSAFTASLAPENSTLYKIRATGTQTQLVAKKSNVGVLTPREIAILIQLYGLADGKRKTAEELTEKYDLKAKFSINVEAQGARSKLKSREALAKLVRRTTD